MNLHRAADFEFGGFSVRREWLGRAIPPSLTRRARSLRAAMSSEERLWACWVQSRRARSLGPLRRSLHLFAFDDGRRSGNLSNDLRFDREFAPSPPEDCTPLRCRRCFFRRHDDLSHGF
jgi:hypothetical protein